MIAMAMLRVTIFTMMLVGVCALVICKMKVLMHQGIRHSCKNAEHKNEAKR